MISKRIIDYLKLLIPLSALLLMLLTRFTVLGDFLKMEDSIIYMICGLTFITGIETYSKNKTVGFFLISSSLILMAMRAILIFGLK